MAMNGALVYAGAGERVLGRVLSLVDLEATSVSRGCFDRTWWCWKFTDFPAPRFQEGIYTLAWLLTSPLARERAPGNRRLLEALEAAVGFWAGLQHPDGSFDEAYPFERSLAATAFTGFYVGAGLQRTAHLLSAKAMDQGSAAIERAARWLSRSGESHGVLSNHLAAAAAAAQVAGELLGTDRFAATRDRFLSIIMSEQDRSEGWLREYGGADPGYQSHGMFYLAEVWKRTGDDELRDCLVAACDFMSWFVHPDGSVGGEYASRGTKFAYPAAFETLARVCESASATAAHLRRAVAQGRVIGPGEMDAWNLFPVLNNYLFAAEAAEEPAGAGRLPWQEEGAVGAFPRAGLAVAAGGGRLLVAAPGRGGALKLWERETGELIYEDCGYGVRFEQGFAASQGESAFAERPGDALVSVRVSAEFRRIASVRFHPWRFAVFRVVNLTVGRIPGFGKWLKRRLVRVLIRRRPRAPGRLERTIVFERGGDLVVEDRLTGMAAAPIVLERHVAFHMGSARYQTFRDFLGARVAPPTPEPDGDGAFRRVLRLAAGTRTGAGEGDAL